MVQTVTFSSVQFSRSVVSDSLRPHELQPTRLLCPWDLPGKSTEVGCHRLLHYLTLAIILSCLLIAVPARYVSEAWETSHSQIHT